MDPAQALYEAGRYVEAIETTRPRSWQTLRAPDFKMVWGMRCAPQVFEKARVTLQRAVAPTRSYKSHAASWDEPSGRSSRARRRVSCWATVLRIRLAVHVPVAKDNIDQPHMHLMFSERAVNEAMREIPEERFFKRNGAKKDPSWNDRNKPNEVREKWVELMNRAMERAGQEQRLDARSWADRGARTSPRFGKKNASRRWPGSHGAARKDR